MIWKYFITPVMGTVIGYGTNYIAVRMLFRPKKEVKLLGHTLPFTPGAIPKGKERLAKAVGDVVGTALVTKDDIKSKLLSDNTQTMVVEKITEILNTEIKSEIITLSKLDEEAYSKVKSQITDAVTKQLINSINDMEIGSIIAKECGKSLNGSSLLSIIPPMIKMFLNDEIINRIAKMVGEGVQKYIDENGYRIIGSEVEKKIDDIEKQSVSDLLVKFSITEKKITDTITDFYQKMVDKALDELFAKLDISKMIEDKVNAMDVDELEVLVLKVMKKELDTIVNLGAVIGLIMGLINMIINIFL